MRSRIRAASLIVRDSRILLVQHVHPVTKAAWWVPPGGCLEDTDSSIFACAAREAFEETGLKISVSRIVYIREFVDNEYKVFNLELFLPADGFAGSPSLSNIGGCVPDEHYIKDIRWMSRREMAGLPVYPEILKDQFWADLAGGFSQMRYLGRAYGP